ncbi:hypothetical protein [uncultured Hydrogenophaga sp.]|uniref:hypothetical protein n=1 Tax=uncultured Hydrogenophaga sp. TaxID=199683 RepID=UPI00258F27F2|nr:hypothetical protein [uncultured Hydrogenophaga sp.]
MNRFARAIVCFALALAGGGVFAQPVPATDPVPRVAFPRTNVGNISTFGPRTADAANAAKFSFGVATNGAIFANTGDRLPTPGGASIPIGIGGTIAKPNVAAAIGRFARKALPLLSVGSALYDLGQELGYTLDNSSGTLQIQGSLTEYGYRRGGTQPNGQLWPVRSSIVLVCHDIMASTIATNGFLRSVTATHSTYDDISIGCAWSANPGGNTYGAVRTKSVTPQPATVEDFENAIAAKSGWPTSSALARATVDAIKSGEALQVDPQTVTGPATSPGPSSTTHNPTNDTTTVSATTHHYTYTGPSVSISTVTNTSTINNTTQEVISEQETTDNPVVPDAPAAEETPFTMPCGVAGTPACAVKVDETGMPDADDVDSDQLKDVEDEHRTWLEGIADANPFPDIAWDFALPTACGVIPTPAFEPMLESIDVCQFQPMFHELMTVVWMLGGLFGAISLFMKSSLSQ